MNTPNPECRREALAAFERLLYLDESDREAALAALAATQPEVHAQVLALLQADREAEAQDFLGNAAVDSVGTAESPRLKAGARFGPYRLERRIGAGGMGEVWLARRDDGLYQGKVAIKLLYAVNQPGMRERFAREGQILGRLQHPDIARLLDAGVDGEGSLYLVLEYVEGSRIDHWCDQRRLDLAQRLRLFMMVCEAVARAHAQLVVHRDLKPSNILVTAEGKVKLLDFGIAKLLEADRGDGTDSELTLLAGRPMTPEYAAPEQLLGQPVTTATDVYALGVLLHLLLAGDHPYDSRRGTPAQLEQAVLTGEPRTLNRSFAAAPTAAGLSAEAIAERRGSTPQRLRRQLRGDLDNIVAKTLRKDPAKRYPTVLALADDLRRHLDHQPVLARGESLRYRGAKFLRRHRLGAAAAAALVLAVAAGVAGVAWQAHRALMEAREAQIQERRAERVKEFLVGVFKAADPSNAQRSDMSARDVLDQGARQMQTQLAEEPELQAEMYDTLAETYLNLGADDRALELANTALAMRRKLLPPGDMHIAESLEMVGEVLNDRGSYPEAYAALAEAQRIAQAGPEPDGLSAARIMNQYSSALSATAHRAEAVQVQRQAYAIFARRLGADARETGEQLLDLAERLELNSQYDEAGQRYTEAIAVLGKAVGPDSMVVGEAHLSYGSLLDRTGRHDQSEQEHIRAITILRTVLGNDHPMVAEALFSRAILYIGQRRYAEAEADLHEALRIYPAGSYKAALCQDYLGGSLVTQGRYAEALPLLREAVATFRNNGPDEIQTYRALAEQATAELRSGQLKEAEAELRTAVSNLERLVGAEGYEVRTPLKRLGEALVALKQYNEAVTVLRRVDALERKLFGDKGNVDSGSTHYLLAKALMGMATAPALAEAAALTQQSVTMLRQSSPGKDLGLALLLQARLAQQGGDGKSAHAELTEAVEQLSRAVPADPADLADAQKLLAGSALAHATR